MPNSLIHVNQNPDTVSKLSGQTSGTGVYNCCVFFLCMHPGNFYEINVKKFVQKPLDSCQAK